MKRSRLSLNCEATTASSRGTVTIAPKLAWPHSTILRWTGKAIIDCVLPPTGSRPSTVINSDSVNLSTETESRRLRISPASVVITATLTALAGCGGDNLLLPSDGQPAQISVARGNDQTGTVGQPLGDSLVVLVTDPGGRPVKAVEVVFVPPTGATVEPTTVLTGTNGEAAVHY